MPEEFDKTTNIVNTTLLPRTELSVEAESALDSTVSTGEARRLLEQTGQGYLVNIPLMKALSMWDSAENPYRIDRQALFDIFSTNGERICERIRKSYNEVVGLVDMSGTGNAQGVKRLTEYKKRLVEAIGVLSNGREYYLLDEVVRLFVLYLKTSYVLMGRQQ